MRIAVDMDDTIVDFFPYVLACIEREYCVTINMDEITDWDNNRVKELRIFANGGNWWAWLQTRDWLWTKAPAITGAIGGLRCLRDRGHAVELLTTKPEWAEWVVWAWLGKWRPAVQTVTIVGEGQVKADISCADMLVDDGPHNLAPWAASGREAIVFDRPWNRSYVDAGRVRRAYNWADVLRIVGEV